MDTPESPDLEQPVAPETSESQPVYEEPQIEAVPDVPVTPEDNQSQPVDLEPQESAGQTETVPDVPVTPEDNQSQPPDLGPQEPAPIPETAEVNDQKAELMAYAERKNQEAASELDRLGLHDKAQELRDKAHQAAEAVAAQYEADRPKVEEAKAKITDMIVRALTHAPGDYPDNNTLSVEEGSAQREIIDLAFHMLQIEPNQIYEAHPESSRNDRYWVGGNDKYEVQVTQYYSNGKYSEAKILIALKGDMYSGPKYKPEENPNLPKE